MYERTDHYAHSNLHFPLSTSKALVIKFSALFPVARSFKAGGVLDLKVSGACVQGTACRPYSSLGQSGDF